MAQRWRHLWPVCQGLQRAETVSGCGRWLEQRVGHRWVGGGDVSPLWEHRRPPWRRHLWRLTLRSRSPKVSPKNPSAFVELEGKMQKLTNAVYREEGGCRYGCY